MGTSIFKQMSKREENDREPLDCINTGSLQRIADALEVIADQLILINKEKTNKRMGSPA